MRLILTILFFLSASSYASDLRIVYWDKKPVRLVLPVGDRVQVYLDEDVKFDTMVPPTHLEIESTGKTVYLRARAEFGETLLKLVNVDTEEHYLLDISSKKTAVPTSIRLKQLDAATNEELGKSKQKANGDPRVELVRFASQSLYPYSRTRPSSNYISTSSITSEIANRFVNDLPVNAMPIKAWRGFGFYVTAVKLENTAPYSLNIDPRKNIRGRWIGIVFQHPSLHESGRLTAATELSSTGTQNNVTTAYVISKEPFWEALSL